MKRIRLWLAVRRWKRARAHELRYHQEEAEVLSDAVAVLAGWEHGLVWPEITDEVSDE